MKTSRIAQFKAGTAPLVLGLALIATPAFAQDAAEGEDEGGDIVVTGSLITNPNLEQASPVLAITSDELDLRQTNVAEQFLRELPGAVPSVGSAVNNGNGGASFVNLRGVGSVRNLVLLDGRRIVPADTTGRVDLNNIPLAIIDRTDILTGGATTAYGADAVSGVVNFVTRRDFSGLEAEFSNQITERGDGHAFRADLTIGANFDDGRGNAVISLGYQESDAVTQGSRPFSEFNIDSFSGAAGGSSAAVPAVLAGYGGPLRQISPDGQSLVPFYAPFNFNPQNIFQTPFERFNLYSAGHYEVSDAVEVYAQALFSRQTVSTRIASGASFFNTYDFSLNSPFIPVGIRNTICAAQGITQPQCDAAAIATGTADPNYRQVRFQARRRFVEAGTRDDDYTSTVFNFTVGARGGITDSLSWDVSGSYGESENVDRRSGFGLFSRLQQSLLLNRDAVTGAVTCQDAANNCAPFNLFGLAGSITPEMLEFVVGPTQTSTTATTLSSARGLITGDLGFGFAETPISIAIGTEYREYTASSVSDLSVQTPGEVLGAGGAAPDVFGGYDVYEGFAEVVAPIIEDVLTLEAGARYSEYSTAGGEFTWKVGGSFEPIQGLRFRGNYQRGSRAPNIGELFLPTVVGLDNLSIDPCAGAAPVGNANLRAVCLAQGAPVGQIGLINQPAAGQINITTGGNPLLGVENATTWTVGLVFTNDALPGFSASIDYFNIEVTEAITSPTSGDVIAACFGSVSAASATDPACTGIRRNPGTGALDGSPADTPGLPLLLSNLGFIATDGVDLSLRYRTDINDDLELTLSFDGTWTNENIFQATPSGVARDCVGFYSVNCGSIQPEYAFTQRSTLIWDQFSASLLWRYIHGVEYEPLAIIDDGGDANSIQQQFRTIPAEHYFDLTFRWEVSDELTFTASAINLLDNQPKVVGSTAGSTAFNSGNIYPSSYDPLGRRYAVSVRLRF